MVTASENLIGWYAGENEEFFTEGPFTSRQDAIEEGRSAFDGEGFYVCKAQRQDVYFCAKRLIEEQYLEADDLFDFDYSNGPERLGDHAAADVELQELLDAWTAKWRKTFAQPTLFYQTISQEYIEAEPIDEDDDCD